ncbi:hypothetical protein C8N43_0356 [Litoreibacter ponti]|uniref:Uncharacterized protein n=1 Tax=Litoreibacter ponti TaxID=1510457 RepID=A0A2T6BI31_9RHOB|nr:hypothetical protein [Litoreibacter ponti]PTX55715.1 hypothetical protein C8N43_0356 [Litoreibacter ponti]
MKNLFISAALAASLAVATVGDAHAGVTPAPAPSSSSGNNDVVIAVFVLALGALIFGQGFGQQQRKVKTQKNEKTSEY